MRITVALLLLLGLTTGLAGAQELKMEARTYDISKIAAVRRSSFGPRLGPAPSFRSSFDEIGEIEPERLFEIDMVADLIREMVEPDVWDEGGEVEVRQSGLLVVRAPARTQELIKALLGDLEAAASRRIRFRVEAFGLDLDRTGKAYSEIAAAPDAAAVDLGKYGATLLESASLEVDPGARGTVKVLNRVRYVGDYDVEIAQGSNISDPIVQIGREGLVADFVAHPTTDGSRIVVESLIQQGKFDRPIRTVNLGRDEEYFARPFRSDKEQHLGILELPLYRHSDVFTTRIVKPRDTFLIPVQGDDRFVVFRVRTELLGLQAPGWIIDIGAISRRPQGHFFGYPSETDEETRLRIITPGIYRTEGEPPFLGGPEEMLDSIINTVNPDYWDEEGAINICGASTLVMKADEGVRAGVARYLKQCEALALRQVDLDLRVYSVAGSVQVGSGDSASTASGAQLRQATTVSTLPKRYGSVMCGNKMNYVLDYDVEVAQEARIADPIVATSFEGMAMNLLPMLSEDRKTVRLEVHLLLARREMKEPFESGTQFLGPLDTIAEHRTTVNMTVEMPAGGAYTIDAGPDPKVAGRRLAVVLRAKTD